MTANCLEFPYGAVRHFPAGNYYAQTDNWIGETELRLMKVAHSVWYTFKHTAKKDWKIEDTKLFDQLRRRKIEMPPTRRLEKIIRAVYPLSAWAYIVIENMREDNAVAH
jgi:hypothetical protein